ncbi:macrophage migration inhibitory factor family protein [Piromyces finnis]|uniref:L-dopachrome isomerase n=1 Tax=Piromyces finnis TaxID=1754191 RepID=A0A1Y1VLS3_9FUNG|nr:macrophage migration inhibitory factor family protein [Piromyces finnis]|eukprot:ORX59886.1 macrophage migration inhibitory factor family protein [Piromyces finnis]
MPFIEIRTNATFNDKNRALKEVSSLVAKCLGKPESYVDVCIIDNVAMSFGGSTDTAALITLGSLGCIDARSNKSTSAAIFKYLGETIGLNSRRGYIHFIDLPAEDTGYGGSTFA